MKIDNLLFFLIFLFALFLYPQDSYSQDSKLDVPIKPPESTLDISYYAHQGYVDGRNGLFYKKNNYLSTDYIDVSNYDYVEIQLPYSKASGVAYYDKNKNFIKGIHSEAADIHKGWIPDNIQYIRVSCRIDDGVTPFVHMYIKDGLDFIHYKKVIDGKTFKYNALDKSNRAYHDGSLSASYRYICRIPTHVVTNNGTIVIASDIEINVDGKIVGNIIVSISDDNGESFTHHNLGYGASPNLIYDKINDKIFLFQPSYYIYSCDSGLTWSDRVVLPIKPKNNESIYQAPTTGVQLSNGILITPYLYFSYKEGKMVRNSVLPLYSRDYGESWIIGPLTPKGVIANESTIAEYKYNSLMINARGGLEFSSESPCIGRRVFVAKVKNHTRNSWRLSGWSLYKKTDKKLKEPICNASFISIKNKNTGQLWGLFCNPYTDSNPRKNLMIQRSDDFVNWSPYLLMTFYNKEVYGYCSMNYNCDKLSFVYEDIDNGILFSDITRFILYER